MASRLVLMPVLPSVTVSEAEKFDDKGWVARAVSRSLQESQAAPTPDAERIRNSRRCIHASCGRKHFSTIHRFGDYSNCFRNADSCCCISESSLLSSATSFSRLAMRSSAAEELDGVRAGANSVGAKLPESKCM